MKGPLRGYYYEIIGVISLSFALSSNCYLDGQNHGHYGITSRTFGILRRWDIMARLVVLIRSSEAVTVLRRYPIIHTGATFYVITKGMTLGL